MPMGLTLGLGLGLTPSAGGGAPPGYEFVYEDGQLVIEDGQPVYERAQ